MLVLPRIADLWSAAMAWSIPDGDSARMTTVPAVIRRPRAAPRLALCVGGQDEDPDRRVLLDEHRVVQFPRRTPRRVRVGLGMLFALGLWVLVILAGYATFRGIARIIADIAGS